MRFAISKFRHVGSARSAATTMLCTAVLSLAIGVQVCPAREPALLLALRALNAARHRALVHASPCTRPYAFLTERLYALSGCLISTCNVCNLQRVHTATCTTQPCMRLSFLPTLSTGVRVHRRVSARVQGDRP
jgi:hypothetical protein